MRDRNYFVWLFVTVPLLWIACSPVPDGVTMWVESPARVKMGEPFAFSAHVNNESTTAVTLRSLDIGDSYLAGISIDRSEPPFSSSQHIPIDNTVSYGFETAVDPGDHLIVTFHVRATKPGVQQGDFDICVNSEFNCDFQSITTLVEDLP